MDATQAVARFEQTGSPIISDGEQSKSGFATYPLAGLKDFAPDGVVIPFADGHIRQLPRLSRGPSGMARKLRATSQAGAANVQIDFTEARLSLSLDPSGGLLRSFVSLNNQVFDRFTSEERLRIGVHI